MIQLTMSDLAEGARIRARTLTEWRRKGMPARPEGKTVLLDPVAVLSWLEGLEWRVKSDARNRAIAYLRQVIGARQVPSPEPLPDPTSMALADDARQFRDIDPGKGVDQQRALLQHIHKALSSTGLTTSGRTALIRAAGDVLKQMETSRLNQFELAVKMRQLIPVGDAITFAQELASATAGHLQALPGRVADLVSGEGMEVEQAAHVAVHECRVALADAIGNATDTIQEGVDEE